MWQKLKQLTYDGIFTIQTGIFTIQSGVFRNMTFS